MPHKFSIVTPSFKQLEWLKLCAASVADQQRMEFEHIVQDAGTGPELEAWAREQPGLKLFVEKDAGMYDAINRGLKRATGEIVAYLNCDEQYLPGTLEKVSRYFEEHPGLDIVFGDAILVDEQGKPLSYRRTVRPFATHTRLVHLSTLSCAMFFRRQIVEEGFLFPIDYKMIGDAVFVWKLMVAKKRMAVIHEPLSVFTFTGMNLGQTEKARTEALAWRGSPDAPPAVLKWPAILIHRLQKMAAGAYQRRTFNYAIRTRNSGHERAKFEAANLGWEWPKGS